MRDLKPLPKSQFDRMLIEWFETLKANVSNLGEQIQISNARITCSTRHNFGITGVV